MKALKSYWLTTLLCLIFSFASGQTEIYSGELYIKLKTDQREFDSSKPLLQLDGIGGMRNYRALKPSSADSRQPSSILDGLYHLNVDKQTDIRALCEELSTYQNVLYAEPVFQEQLLFVPNDPAITAGNQDYLINIKAFEAWDITQGSEEIVIAISDTGFDRDHQDIQSKIYKNQNDPPNGIDDDNNGYIDDYIGFDFADNDSIAEADNSQHGTRVGGLAGASTNDSTGIAGVGFNTLISPLKVFKSNNNSSSGNYESILYAANNGFDIINLSWGSAGSFSQANQDMINYAVLEKGLIIIAAAGNTPEQVPFYPASYEHVLSVAATDFDDIKAEFSTFNHWVDITAPGRVIYSTQGNNTYGTDGGTSYSTPMAAGAAALVKDQYPNLTPDQILQRIRVSSTPIYQLGTNSNYQDLLGYGRLDIFNALSNDTLRSIRLENITYSNSLGNKVFHGDTVSVSAKVINYLNPTQGQLSFTSTSPYATSLSAQIQLDNLQTLGAQEISAPILFILPDTPPNTTIDVRVGISDHGYEDFQYFTITTEPDRVDIDNQLLKYTITGNGNLAFSEDGFKNGLGLNWRDQAQAGRVSFMIGKDTLTVSDNFYQSTTSVNREMDFNTLTPAKLIKHQNLNLLGANTFADDSASSPMNLAISQKTMTNLNQDFVVHEYRISNVASTSLQNINTGLYVDWNLGNATKNRCFYSDSLKMLVSYSHDTTVFAGLYSYYDALPVFQAIDIAGFNDNTPDLSNDLPDSLKYVLSSTSLYDSAGFSGDGNDISAMIADDSIMIGTGEDAKIAYMMVFGNSLEDLASALDAAKDAYQSYLHTPVLLEQFISCEGASLAIDPTSGDEYRFYSDPLATDLLAEGDTLNTGQINSDTSFYVINLDKAYQSDIQRIDVRLVSQVANFTMSADTLFLDNETNAVTFTDESFLPNSWFWDFGNGIQATLQNPTVSYSGPGTYQVTLSVDNDLGCSESYTKPLLVVQRPAQPDIENMEVCAGGSVELQATNTDTISVYQRASDSTPVFTGLMVTLANLQNDTTLYISNATGPFESLKKAISIDVEEFQASYKVLPNTQSEEISALIINSSQSYQSTQWYVDQNLASNDDTLVLSIEKEDYQISLISTSMLGCIDSLSRSVTFATSPLPTASIGIICHGDDVTIRPSSGTTFGFYANAQLTDPIIKGPELNLESVIEEQTIYIVGLDSILPSDPVALEIAPVLPAVNILASPDTLYLNQGKTASFLIENENITSWQWYLNDSFIESVENPTLFFDQEGTYTISLTAADANGCENTDTLYYQVFNVPTDEPVLGSFPNEVKVYPIPAYDILNIEANDYKLAELISISGQTVRKQSVSKKTSIDTKQLKRGFYLLKLTKDNDKSDWIRIVLR